MGGILGWGVYKLSAYTQGSTLTGLGIEEMIDQISRVLI